MVAPAEEDVEKRLKLGRYPYTPVPESALAPLVLAPVRFGVAPKLVEPF